MAVRRTIQDEDLPRPFKIARMGKRSASFTNVDGGRHGDQSDLLKELCSTRETARILAHHEDVIQEMQKSISAFRMKANLAEQRAKELTEYLLTTRTCHDLPEELWRDVLADPRVRERKNAVLHHKIGRLLRFRISEAASFCNQGKLFSLCYELRQLARIPECADSALSHVVNLAAGFDWNFIRKFQDNSRIHRGYDDSEDSYFEGAILQCLNVLDSALVHAARNKWMSTNGRWTPDTEGRDIHNTIRDCKNLRDEWQGGHVFPESYQLLVAMKDHSRASKVARLVCKDWLPEHLIEKVATFTIKHPNHRVHWSALPHVLELKCPGRPRMGIRCTSPDFRCDWCSGTDSTCPQRSRTVWSYRRQEHVVEHDMWICELEECSFHHEFPFEARGVDIDGQHAEEREFFEMPWDER
ncbi:MAG: hypothetical protein M1820_005477 [Bogoriella megaspora]|nr:MAG: hypothetical protein M1820_005477 [Bogoriella megaspora]